MRGHERDDRGDAAANVLGGHQTICSKSGSVSARASKYKLTEAASPLRGLQDTDHREGTGEDVQAAVVGGNMLITT